MNFSVKDQNFFSTTLPKFLIFSIPLLLITGPLLSDLALSTVVIIYFILVIKKKEYRFFNNTFFFIFLFFYFYIVLNSLFQNQNFDSIKISIFYFRFGVFSLALMYFLTKDPNLLKYIFYSLIFCFLILLIDGLFQYYFPKGIKGRCCSTDFRRQDLFVRPFPRYFGIAP